MRVIGEFNKISDELKKKIQPLLPGSYAKYQILEFRKVTDPDTGKSEIFYCQRELYAKDTIWDSVAEKSVEIGIPDRVEKGEVLRCKTFKFERPRDGMLWLYGDKLEDRELHEILQLSNMCENSILGIDRDQGAERVYRLVDDLKEAKTKNKKRSLKKDIYNYLGTMEPQDFREFAASMNWNHRLPIEEIEAQVGEYAEKYPEEFEAAVVSTDTKRKATIKLALDEGIISYDPSLNKIMGSNGDVLASLERKEGKNHIDMFNDWLASATNGEKILNQLKRKTTKEVTA